MVDVKKEDREAVARAVFDIFAVPSWVEPWVRTGDDDDVPFRWPGRVAVVLAAMREHVEAAEREREAAVAEVGRLVEDVDRLESQIDENCGHLKQTLKIERERDELREKLARAIAERDSIARHRDELVEELDEARAELESLRSTTGISRVVAELGELRVKCAVPDRLRVWAINSRVYGESQLREACDFILQFCKPEPKTRLDMYVEGWLEDGGDADPAMLVSVREEGRKQLRRQGLDPDEVMA